MKKRFLFSSICSIVLCISLISGATFALFTSESKNNISITSGKVEMLSTVENIKTWSLEDDLTLPGRSDGTFTQGGYVQFKDNLLTINKIIPGDKVSFDITGQNNSNVTILYRYRIECFENTDLLLMDGLEVSINDQVYQGLKSYTSKWTLLNEKENFETVHVEVLLPENAGNVYQDLTTNLVIVVEAVQGNAGYTDSEKVELVNFWDGTADVKGLEEHTDEINKIVEIWTAEEFAEFRNQVNKGKTYEGYKVELLADLDLRNIKWEPIGPNADATNKFKGIFNGNNHEIKNLYVNQEPGYHSAGLFGALNGTVQDLVISNANISNISSGNATDNGTAVVAGSIYLKGSINNVTVKESKVNGNRYVGGVTGYAYGNINNCTVENTSIVAQMDNLTGQYDNGDKVGGIVGYLAGEKQYTLNNNTVKGCYIEAERDVAGVVGTTSNLRSFENNYVENTQIVYHSAKTYETASLIASQRVVVDVPASNKAIDTTILLVALTSQNIKDALNNKEDVVLATDVSLVGSTGGYNKAGLVLSGNTIDGKGNTLTVTNANSTWDCAVYHQGGTIKNLVIEGAFRGIFTAGCSSDIIIDNVTIDNVCYTFSSDTGNANYSVIVTNSTLNGWTSYTGGYKSVTFEGCKFGKGTGAYQYSYLRPYNDSTFTNCIFETGFGFDATCATSTLVNCYVGDVLITDANKVELLGQSAQNLVIKNA